MYLLKKKTLLLVFLFLKISVFSQKPTKLNSVEIYNQLEKLTFLGSVLYVAAHPDDENTALISYFANKVKARTAYLSLTRGDGGQNLIGPELREQLGLIRTQELLEARKIDGGEQFFTRANDFGFSKTPTETFEIWDKQKILSDVVWVIRNFQPDVIINRFDHRTAGTTHGHHTASAMLAIEAFEAAADSNKFSEQLQYVPTWQTKRHYFNPSWWFYGSKEKMDAADKSNFAKLPLGVFYPEIGKSNTEIAALSRSAHKSQGFGSTGSRGEQTEYLEPLNSTNPNNPNDIFEGVDTSWNRLKGGKVVGDLLTTIIKNFDFKKPESSVRELVHLYQEIQKLEKSHWKVLKTNDLKKIILACSGLYLEASTTNPEIVAGVSVPISIEATNRSDNPITLEEVTFLQTQQKERFASVLKNNTTFKKELTLALPKTTNFTQAYWLSEPANIGYYNVKNQQDIGLADIKREAKVVFTLKILDVIIPVEQDILYKKNDNVNGETIDYISVVPELSVKIMDKTTLFTSAKTKKIGVQVTTENGESKGFVRLKLPKNWRVQPDSTAFYLKNKGQKELFYFEISPPDTLEEITAEAIATSNNGTQFSKNKTLIKYPHISAQPLLENATATFIKSDLKITSKKIAYIMGAGDAVPEGILQMGYSLSVLDVADITLEKIATFDVFILGIRAFNVHSELSTKKELLMEAVKNGKTLIVQYNTPDGVKTANIAPFSLQLSRDRITDENAEVRFLAPNHSVLNYPNKITENDFKGWKQEQGLYYADVFANNFTPIFASNDVNEASKNGGLLVANYGKGFYIYTGLSFFREIPEGVVGAYRLLSNLISVK